jgi:MarR family transcriptional regulator, organic hydroperoxide resistance regulator
MPSNLANEIRQRKPFRSAAHETTVALLRTADVVRRQLAVVIEPHGITLQQFNVLRILRGAAPEGLPTLEIAERMIEQTPGVTRLLDRLEAKSLVERQRNLIDRRQVFCRITIEGLELLRELDPLIETANESMVRLLSKNDLSSLLALLDAVRASAANDND